MATSNPQPADNRPEPDPSPESGQSQRPGWFTMMLIAVSFYCALLLDPFGIGTASSERSEQAALRITAPFYKDSGQVVVVLIDDDYLQRVGKSWPLPYADQGRLLRSILQASPGLLYLDILYRQRHSDAPREGSGPRNEPLDLVAPIASFTATPLVFSAQLQAELRNTLLPSVCPESAVAQRLHLMDPGSMLPELQSWVASRPDQVQVSLLGWWGCGDRYPLALPGDPAARTPAMAMLAAWCARGDRSGAGCEALAAQGAGRFQSPLVVRWGAFPPAAQQPFYTAGVCQPYADATGGVAFWQALRTSFTQLVLGIFEDLRTSPRRELALPCPAVTVLPAAVVRYGDPEEVAELLRDKVVLLGARVTGVSDWHQSPVHGQVPGVILHAAAVDNLLSLGPRYASDLSSGFLLSLALVLLALMAFGVPVLVIVLDEPKKRWASLAGLLIWLFIAWFLYRSGASAGAVFAAVIVAIAIDLLVPLQTLVYLLVVALLAAGAALLVRFGVAPSNWIGMILIGLAFAATVKQYFRQEELKQFPHRLSVLGPALQPYLDRLHVLEFRGQFDRAIQWGLNRRSGGPPPESAENSEGEQR